MGCLGGSAGESEMCDDLHKNSHLREFRKWLFDGGGGNRTRVLRTFGWGLYVCSRSFVVTGFGTAGRALPGQGTTGFLSGMEFPRQQAVLIPDQPEFVTGLWTPQAGIPQPALPISRQRVQTACWQLIFDRLFTWPADQPRHATVTLGEPVNTDRPPVRKLD